LEQCLPLEAMVQIKKKIESFIFSVTHDT